jgi:hypothetical protein
MLSKIACAVLLIVMAAASGCGEDSSTSDASSDAKAPATTATTATTAPPESRGAPTTAPDEAGGPLAEIEGRLGDAGFTVEENDTAGEGVVAAVDIDGDRVRDVTLILWETPAQAKFNGAQFKDIFGRVPGRGRVKIVEARTYYVAKERKLKPGEITEFERIVEVAEAR